MYFALPIIDSLHFTLLLNARMKQVAYGSMMRFIYYRDDLQIHAEWFTVDQLTVTMVPLIIHLLGRQKYLKFKQPRSGGALVDEPNFCLNRVRL